MATNCLGAVSPPSGGALRANSCAIRENSCLNSVRKAMKDFNDGTYEIIGCAMHVHRAIGPGLREKPYENALMVAFRNEKISAVQQKPYPIYYEGTVVGDCIPDLTVGDVLVDAKSIEKIGDSERAQMLNYLRIAEKPVGLVINFRNAKLEWLRLVR